MVESRPNPLRMAGFALPAMPLNATLTALFVFLPPLYAEFRGLGAAAVGGVFLVAKLFDTVTDPIFGLAADRLETRWGRRRPWLVLSVPILMLSLYRLYLPPETAGYVYFAGWLIIMYVGWTLSTVSHTAWALELSGDYDRRSRITAMLQLAIIAGAVVVSLIPAAMERMGAPSYEERTAAIGLFLVFSLPVAVLICLMSISEPPFKRQPAISWKSIAIVLRTAALFRLMIANALLTFSTYFVQGLFVFFVSFTLGLEDQVGSILLFLIVGGLLCLPLWVKLSEVWSKHKTVQVAVMFGALAPILLLILPPGQLVMTALVFLLIGVNTSANEFLPRSMMADVSDEDSVNTGSDRMGLYYALLQFSSKAASGLAVFIGFTFLAIFGFDPALGAENSAEALQRIRYLIVTLPMAAYAVVIFLMWRYPITRERQQELRRIIEERPAQ